MKMIKYYKRFETGSEYIVLNRAIKNQEDLDQFTNELNELEKEVKK